VDEAAKPLGNLLNKLLTVEHQERLPWILDWRLRGIDDPIALAEQLRLLIKLRRYSGSRRGRPPNLALYSFLSSVADIYKKGTRRKATAARTERKGGDPTWGPFIRFASDCARLADINPAGERALGPVWIRLRKRRIVRA
jgi:hypothetical protein